MLLLLDELENTNSPVRVTLSEDLKLLLPDILKKEKESMVHSDATMTKLIDSPKPNLSTTATIDNH